MCVCVFVLLSLSPIHFGMNNIIIVIVYIIYSVRLYGCSLSQETKSHSKLPIPLALKLFQLSTMIPVHIPSLIRFLSTHIFNHFIQVSPLFLHNTIFNLIFLGRYFLPKVPCKVPNLCDAEEHNSHTKGLRTSIHT